MGPIADCSLRGIQKFGCARHSRTILVGIVMLLLCALSASPVLGLQLTLKWEGNSDTGVVGYNIHCGTASGEHSRIIDVGNRTQVTLDGLEDGQDYFFTATAYDEEGESGESMEVQYVPVTHNERPKAEDMIFHADRGSNYRGELRGTDADGHPLEFIIVCPPTQGTLELEDSFNGVFTYTPHPDATGSDTFLFKTHDGLQDSNIAIVTVTLAAPEALVSDNASLETDDPDAEPDHSWMDQDLLVSIDGEDTEYIDEDGLVHRSDIH